MICVYFLSHAPALLLLRFSDHPGRGPALLFEEDLLGGVGHGAPPCPPCPSGVKRSQQANTWSWAASLSLATRTRSASLATLIIA